MQFQINTGGNIVGGQDLTARVASETHTRLDRYRQHITGIVVHLSDADADKSGSSDKHCLIEARLEGHHPQVSGDQAPTLAGAYSGAAKRLPRALKTSLGKRHHSKGADTIRAGEP